MNKTEERKIESSSKPTDAEIRRMREEAINWTTWEAEMKTKVHQMATSGKLVVIKSDEGNIICIAAE